jgi:hypothetical protein
MAKFLAYALVALSVIAGTAAIAIHPQPAHACVRLGC